MQLQSKENILAEPVLVYHSNQKDRNPCFIDPLDDRWFKRLFGAEQNKALTITFLNHVLKGKRQVISIEFLKNEYPGETKEEGSVTVDVICKDQNGNIFLIEIQKDRQKNFKKRSLYYASRLITEQAPHGNRKDWGYALKEVYVICLLEKFTINAGNKQQWMHDIALSNTDTGMAFNESLRFTYIELISFKKPEDQLETELEKWIYALKNLKHLKEMPAAFTEPELVRFCEAARYINLTKEEKNMISAKTKARWDYYSALGGAREEGEEIGETRGEARGRSIGEALGEARGAHENAIKTAKEMLDDGFSTEQAMKYTKLSLEEIQSL